MFDIKVIESLSDISHLNNTDEVFADIETDGLYINTRLVQVYQPSVSPDTVYIMDTDILDLEDIKDWLKDKWTIWQGGSYDFGTLNMTTRRFDDTLYLARSAYPQWKVFSLDSIVDNLGLGHLYEGINKKAMQKAGFVIGSYLSQAQLKYAATDVYALSKIWADPGIQAARKLVCYSVDILSLKYSVVYQQNKLTIKQDAVRKELDKLVDDIASNSIKLDGLNPNSPKQVKEFLGTDGSAKEILIGIITKGTQPDGTMTEKAAMAKLVYDQRRLLKRRTSLTSYNYPWVITRFNPAGAATGRFTSTGKDLPRGINAQQVTRDLQYIFNSDDDTKSEKYPDGSSVVHADYSTAELRAGCSIMKDAQMYKELMAGIDLHKVAASLASGGKPIEDITKEERQRGKPVSFGFIFGMSAPAFVEYAFVNYGVVFTPEESAAIKKSYVTRYKGIARYAKDRWSDYKTNPVSTPLGRRNTPRLGTDAINFATQGCIAETMKLAIHYLCKEYPKALDYIYNIVHDAGYLRVPRGQEKLWADRLVSSMKKGWVEMCKSPMLYYKDIPMPVEVEYYDYSSGTPVFNCIER